MPDLAACREPLQALIGQLQTRIEAHNAMCCINTLIVKIKFADFTQTTVECGGSALVAESFFGLLTQGFAREGRPLRLLGIGVRLVPDTLMQKVDFQLGLFNDSAPV